MLNDDVVVNRETIILLGMTCLTNCRGKESNLPKKKNLMHKLVKIMDSLWETESINKELTTQRTLQKLKNEPGELQAITQPNKQGKKNARYHSRIRDQSH